MKFTPSDTRYIPFVQQPMLCAAACIQMIMYKNNIPLISAKELAGHLGLIVPKNVAKFLFKPVVSEKLPESGYYGTQIFDKKYEPNKIFRELGIPLSFKYKETDKIANANNLIEKLKKVEEKNGDVLINFNSGYLYRNKTDDRRHVVVFDRIVDDRIRVINTEPLWQKWEVYNAKELYQAMKRHKGAVGGLWYFDRKKEEK